MSIPLTARLPLEFRPLSLKDDPRLRAIAILVRVPTYFEKDGFSVALMRAGVVSYSPSQIRESLLAGISPVFGEDRFEELHAEFEELWQAADAMGRAQRRRLREEIEMRERELAKPEDKRLTEDALQKELGELKPDVVISEQRRVTIVAKQNEVSLRYQPLANILADMSEQKSLRDWHCIEKLVVGWTGLEHEPEPRDGSLKRHESEYLRGEIGEIAFEEIADFIFALHGIDKDLEKNLALLLSSMSA